MTQKEVRQKWVEALRSGAYKQGRCALRSADDEFCCLGVLCDLGVKAGIIPEPVLESSSYKYYDRNGFLPQSIMNWVGIRTNYGEMNEGHDLTTLNDSDKYTFSQIADVIAEEPEGLFIKEKNV